MWVIVHEVLSWSPIACNFFLHFLSLTAAFFSVLHTVDFTVAQSLCYLIQAHVYISIKSPQTDGRLSGWAVLLCLQWVFPLRLYAKGCRQLVIYCCNKHQQTNGSILCCFLFFSACWRFSGCALFMFMVNGGKWWFDFFFFSFQTDCVLWRKHSLCSTDSLIPKVSWVCRENKSFVFLLPIIVHGLFYITLIILCVVVLKPALYCRLFIGYWCLTGKVLCFFLIWKDK